MREKEIINKVTITYILHNGMAITDTIKVSGDKKDFMENRDGFDRDLAIRISKYKASTQVIHTIVEYYIDGEREKFVS